MNKQAAEMAGRIQRAVKSGKLTVEGSYTIPALAAAIGMTRAQLRQAVKIVHGRAETEASGGVNLKTVHAIAGTGVDFISVGAVTHSARAVDIGLDFEK